MMFSIRPSHPFLLYILFLGLFPSAHTASAQQHYFNFIEAGYESGSPIKTNETTRNMMKQSLSTTLQVSIGHQFSAADFGDIAPRRYYPSIGATLTYGDFSHVWLEDDKRPDVQRRCSFGHFLSAAVTFSQYYYCQGHFRLKSNIENGIAYAFNPYDAQSNPYSTIGGHIQVYFSYGLFLCYAHDKEEFSIGPQFSHYSNSGIYRPNSGINNMAFSFRYKHSDTKEIPRNDPDQWPGHFKPYHYVGIMASAGAHTFKESSQVRKLQEEHGLPTSKHYTVYGDCNISADVMSRVSPHRALGVGLDVFYRGGYKALTRYYQHVEQDDEEDIRKCYIGVAFKHETYIKNFAINVNVGCYLNAKHLLGVNSYTRVYERIGMKYYWGKDNCRPYVGYFIKGNHFIAEQFEVCCGMALKRPQWRSKRLEERLMAQQWL